MMMFGERRKLRRMNERVEAEAAKLRWRVAQRLSAVRVNVAEAQIGAMF